MRSPFPGMDPYLESPLIWPDVHASVINMIRELLTPQVAPRFFVGVEHRVYIIDGDDEAKPLLVPDLAVLVGAGGAPRGRSPRAKGLAPVLLTVTDPIEVRESRLVVRRVGGDRAVVTAIEVLSPANKTRGSRGRETYIAKRDEVFASGVNLVEIDLLRAGERAPSLMPWPRGDYLVHVSRAHKRPQGEAFVWNLRDELPEIPIPLGKGDPDAVLDLARAVRETYDRARYDLEIDYGRPPEPPLRSEDAPWAARLLGERGRSGRRRSPRPTRRRPRS